MLDFRTKSSPRSEQARQQRRHLLAILMILGIVMILVGRARDPALWRWDSLLLSPPQETGDRTAIDNRLDAVARSKTHPDAFVSPGERLAAKPPRPGSHFSDVESTDLEAVRDDTPSSRAEQAVSLRLLNILKTTDPDTLRKASLGPVTYAQLFRQPDQYRGRLVTVSGIVRRANPIELFSNKWGFKQYYQVWLWPSDNPSAPMVVYCLQLPKGFPIGMELAEQVDATGFFFKRCAYEAKDGLRTAPELLADTLTWQRRPLMLCEPAETWAIPLVVSASALAALLATWYVYIRTRPTQPALPERTPDFTRLDNLQEKP